MLRDGGASPGIYDKSCILPFYQTKMSKTWVIGNLVLADYYQVFDFTQSSGDLAMGLGLKDPSFDYEAGGGGLPDKIKEHGHYVAIVISCVLIALSIVGCVCFKKRKINKQEFVFDTVKEYADFGSMKKGINYSQKTTSDENSKNSLM